MADFPVLTSPDGSTSFNIGSVMLADGVDYGMAAMFPNAIGGNALTDGGALGAKWNPPRMFKFPIRLATVGALTPAGVSDAIRAMAQNGAWVDLMLAGVATTDAVRFDVIDGRVRESQDVRMWQGARRRDAVLELDVQPLGYLPTWITLASSASVGLPGSLVIPGGSIIGDGPGLAQVGIMSNLPSQQLGAAGTYGFDAAFYSFGNKAPAFVPAASFLQIAGGFGVAASLVGDAAAPGSQIQRIFFSPSAAAQYNVQVGWQPLLMARTNASYFGRYRVYAFAKSVSPSWGGAVAVAADAVMGGFGKPTGMASGGIIASVGQPLTLASDGAYVAVPTGFAFYPLGEVTIPTQLLASVDPLRAGNSVRIWANVPSTGVPTVTLDIAGLWMQSLDGAHGVVSRDLQVANADSGNSASYFGMYPFVVDSAQRTVQAQGGLGGVTPASLTGYWLTGQLPGFGLTDRFRGPFPQLSPSMLSMEIMLAARKLQTAYKNEVLQDLPKVWWRFNEPSGASVVLDYSGNGINGKASVNTLLGASSLLYGEPGGATMSTGYVGATSAAIPNGNAPRTIEAWYQPATVGAGHHGVVVLGATEAAGGVLSLSFLAGNAVINYTTGANPSWAYTWQAKKTYHAAVSYSGTHATFYVNGQALTPTVLLPAALTTIPQISVGNLPLINTIPAFGGIDEVAVYASALSADRILAHYIAGRNTMGATSPPVFQKFGYAGVSVRYQPRFTFSKEI